MLKKLKNNKIAKMLSNYLLTCFVMFVKMLCIGIPLCVIWQGLELLIEGTIMPSVVDTIFCLALTFSIYLNLENTKNRRVR